MILIHNKHIIMAMPTLLTQAVSNCDFVFLVSPQEAVQ
jgi:hypothetical protein